MTETNNSNTEIIEKKEAENPVSIEIANNNLPNILSPTEIFKDPKLIKNLTDKGIISSDAAFTDVASTDERVEAIKKIPLKKLYNLSLENDNNLNLGFFGLEKVAGDKKNITPEFITWAEKISDKNKCLQNMYLNRIIDKYIDDFKYVTGIFEKNYEEPQDFDKCLNIISTNSYKEGFSCFEKLLKGINTAYRELKDNKKNKHHDENFSKIKKSIDSVFRNVNSFILNLTDSNNYDFIKGGDPKEIGNLFEIIKDFENNEIEDVKVTHKENVLHGLMDYYASYFKNFKTVEREITDRWSLNNLFSIFFKNSEDKAVKQQILKSYDSNNKYFSYLPFDIIKLLFEDIDNDNSKTIIAFLEKRYNNEGSEKEEIKDWNDKVILSDKIDFGIRQKAFDWYYRILKNEDEEELKIWCKSILFKLLESDNKDFIDSLEFSSIKEKCYSEIPDDNDSIKKVLEVQMKNNDTSANVLDCVKKYFEQTEKLEENGFKNKMLDYISGKSYAQDNSSIIIDFMEYSILQKEGYASDIYLKAFDYLWNSREKNDYCVDFLWNHKSDIFKYKMQDYLDKVAESQDVELIKKLLNISWKD